MSPGAHGALVAVATVGGCGLAGFGLSTASAFWLLTNHHGDARGGPLALAGFIILAGTACGLLAGSVLALRCLARARRPRVPLPQPAEAT